LTNVFATATSPGSWWFGDGTVSTFVLSNQFLEGSPLSSVNVHSFYAQDISYQDFSALPSEYWILTQGQLPRLRRQV